jgi:hypothetical protein
VLVREAAMKLMTKEIAKSIPPLYETESVPTPDKILRVKFFDPCGRGTWYAVEFDGEDRFFGYAVSPLGPDCDEWGYFSLQELESVRNRFKLGIERDLHFMPAKFSEVVSS